MVPIVLMDGTKSEVKVRQLPIRQLATYDTKQADEPALVEFLCGKDEGWADLLTHESYEAVVTTGVEINRGPFERYIARLAERLDVMKGSRKILVDAGHLAPTPPAAKPAKGELLVMAEVVPAAVAAPAPTPVPTPVDPPSTPSLAPSALPVSSPQTEEH